MKHEALEDMQKPPEPLPKSHDIYQNIAQQIITNPEHVARMTLEPDYQVPLTKAVSMRSQLALKTLNSKAFNQAEPKQKVALMLSHLGVGPGKAFQILASDEN